MTKSIKYIIVFLITSMYLLSAERDGSKGIVDNFLSDISSSLTNFRRVGTSFVNCYPRTLYNTGGLVGTTMLGMTVDDEFRDLMLRNRTEDTRKFFKFATKFGDRDKGIMFGGAVYLGGLFTGLDDVRTTGRLLLESMLVSGIITGGLKIMLGRSRPYTENGNMDFRFFQADDAYQSLPSGHATISFSMATVLAFRIDKWWSYAGFYSIAGLIAGSRLYLDLHYISDVLAGSIIGTLGSLLVLEAENCRTAPETRKLALYPTLNGIMLSYSF